MVKYPGFSFRYFIVLNQGHLTNQIKGKDSKGYLAQNWEATAVLDDFGLDRLHQFHWIMHVEKWKKCATHCAVHDPKKAGNLKHKLWQQLPQHGEATKHLRIFASQPLLSTYFSRCSLAIHSSGRCFEIADSALWLCFKAAYHREPNAFWILQNKLSKPNLPAIM